MEGEYELTFEGFTCPTPLVNDFTPDQFAEMVSTFKRYDADGSETIGLDEMAQLLEDLDMGHAIEKATELMSLIDTDGSGELDFSEFCYFFSRLVRGDTALRGFNAVAEALNETPVSIVEDQARRRNLTVDFKVVDERAPTSMHAAHFVVECTLTGVWYDRDKGGKPTKFVGAKKFQGIGKSTRSAKFKCAQNCLSKLKNAMPGMGIEPGEIPEKWLQWAHENLEKGVNEGKVLKKLVNKGFTPASNAGFMQALTVVRHLRHALNDPAKGELLFAGEEVGQVNDELDAFLDERLRQGFDGPVLLQTLQQFGFEVERAPGLVQRLRKHELSAGSMWKGAPQTEATTRSDERVRDFFRACREGALDEVELYILASQNLDARKATPGSQARGGLHFAAVSGRVKVCRALLQHHANPNLADATGRTAMHLAAAQGHVKTLKCLDQFGGDAHLLDSQHNSPLHLAAKHAHKKAVAFLTALEDDYQRRVLTGAIPAVAGVLNDLGTYDFRPVTFADLCGKCFTHFLDTKNHPKDYPRFRKDWLFEGCLWVVDQFSAQQRRFVTSPSQTVCEYVLATKDPDPHSGYYVGARGREVYVKTVETLDLFLVLLTAVFRASAGHTPNKLGRTALHEACFENHVDSHLKTVDVMVNQRSSNMELLDNFGKRAFDELVIRRGRPGTPTGSDLREHMIMDRRDDLVEGLLKKRREEEDRITAVRQKATLEEAIDDSLGLNKAGWSMVRTSAQPRFRLDPYLVYEDPDTGTFFFVKRTAEEINGVSVSLSDDDRDSDDSDDDDSDDDDSLTQGKKGDSDDDDGDESEDEDEKAERAAKEKAAADALAAAEAAEAAAAAADADGSAAAAALAERYSWRKPVEYEVRLRLKVAVEAVRNRCQYLRSVGEWDMMRDERLGVEWWAHAATSEARFTTPPECTWPALLAASKQKGVLGVGQKWAVMVDPDGNTFYKDRLNSNNNDVRWENPPDAIRLHLGSVATANAASSADNEGGGGVGGGGGGVSGGEGSDVIGHAEFGKCTRFVFGSAAVEQNWYTAEGLTAAYKLEVDKGTKKFVACMPCAKKLLRAVNGCVEACGGAARKGDKKQEDAISAALSDESHPVLGGRGKQCQGLKFRACAKSSCLVYRLSGLEPAGVGELAQSKRTMEASRQCSSERARQAARRREQPCVLAVVPHTFQPPGATSHGERQHRDRFRPRVLRGWNLCRRRRQSDPLFGWRALHDPEPRLVLQQGDVVRARREGDLYGWHPAVVKQRRGNFHYDVAFGAKDVQRQTRREDIDDDGPVFWWHMESGKSQWEVPDEVIPFELDRERKLAESRAARSRGGGNTAAAAAGGGGGGGGAAAERQGSRMLPAASGGGESEGGNGGGALVDSGNGSGGGGGGALVVSSAASVGSVDSGSFVSSFGGDDYGEDGSHHRQVVPQQHQQQQHAPLEMVLDKDDQAFMSRYHDLMKPRDVPWPWLSGDEWEKDLVVRCGSEARRKDLGGWDEFLDLDTGMLFYRHNERFEQETAARSIQHAFRVRHCKPLLSVWESSSFTFEMPQAVQVAMDERSGWAVLRRRGVFKRKVKDEAEQFWSEAADTVSGDHFYTEQSPDKGWSTWINPQSKEDALKNPANKDDASGVADDDGAFQKKSAKDDPTLKQTRLRVGDAVKFRFVESPDWVDSEIIREREDEDTGERMYDVQASKNKDLSLKWVPRYAIRLHPDTQEQVDEAREERNWSLQLARAREAHERQEKRDHAEEAERLRRLRRGPGQSNGEEAIGEEELQRYREERGALEKRQRLERAAAKAAEEARRRAMWQAEEEEEAAAAEAADAGAAHSLFSSTSSLASPTSTVGDGGFRKALLVDTSAAAAAGGGSRLQLQNSPHSASGGGGGGGGGIVARVQQQQQQPGVYISSDEGSDDDNDEEGDGMGVAMQKPPMSEEDAMALAEARLKIKKQKMEREQAMKEEKEERAEREGWLSLSEDKGTSPRTQRRRVIHRNMHRALMRQKDDFVICRWGCGQWVRAGRQEFRHQRELCSKRILQCVLKCACRMREEQWLASYVPPDEGANSDGESDDASTNGSSSEEEENDGGGGGGGNNPKEEGNENNDDGVDESATIGTGATGATKSKSSVSQYPEMTVQRHHEEQECVRRLVGCPRKCGEWVSFEDLKHHYENVCVKRPSPVLVCRLGCGVTFSGGVHRMIQCEEDRFEHETEMCPLRTERCTWKGCAATFPANQRSEHRRKHIVASGIVTYTVPGTYKYRVPSGCEQVQVQLWGGGGGSGHLLGQSCGDGGGGSFTEALVTVRPRETLEVTVGACGAAGTPGSTVVTQDPRNPAASHVEEVLGVAHGGFPGGGIGHSANTQWAAGGGGGYSMIERTLPMNQGYECVAVAGGGGGGGCRDGVPGATDKGELPGTKIDSLNGRMGTEAAGGDPGDSGEGTLCDFGSEPGTMWQGGNGASFGGGGGGGYHGGGGGGAAPGIVGAGGGGSAYANRSTCSDVVFIQGEGWKPGAWSDPDLDNNNNGGGETSRASSRNSSRPSSPSSLLASASPAPVVHVATYDCPLATGSHELDKVGGRAGEGGKKDLWECFPGKNGAVRILRPGFYADFNPDRHKRPYIGGARRQEMLLPIGTPVEVVLQRAEKAHAEHLDLLERKARGVA